MIGGLLLAALGAGALAVASAQPFSLASGRPGPGFAPVLIGAALVTLGVLHALIGRSRSAEEGAARVGCEGAGGQGAGGARPGLMLCAAIASFALLLPPAGFVPAAWAAGSLALAAAPGLGAGRIVVWGGLIAAAASVLFLAGFGLTTPAFGPR